jgi:superfamily II DNA or RNA helicase
MNKQAYVEFLASKRRVVAPTGISSDVELSPTLFPFQAAVTRWALRRGRAALWLDTGLGKSACAIEWARCVCQQMIPAGAGRVLILTPLCVAQQFVREGERIGVQVNLCREPEDARPGINVTNYDRLERFVGLPWDGVVLDESSVLKDATSATRSALIDGFRDVKFKLACSATPAPNDHTEIGNHAEFLGVMTRIEMLSMFFVHDGETTQEWRLKGHARSDFWEWVAGWALAIRKPSDLGFENAGYELPPLRVLEHICEANAEAMAREAGLLFGYEAKTLGDLRAARKASLGDRVARVAEMVNGSDEPWLVWCDMNAESEALTGLIPEAVEVTGSMPADEKEAAIMAFVNGESRVLVTKPSIAGAGLNLQRCSKMAFAGLSFSWEQFYQAIRRCYRFGQTRPVDVHIVTSSAELAVLQSIKRKQADADAMAAGMISHMRASMLEAIGGTRSTTLTYDPKKRMTIPKWLKPEARL